MKKTALDAYHLAVAVTVLPLAFAGPLGRLALNYGATPLIISFWRLLFAVIGTAIYTALNRSSREAIPRLTRQQLVKAAAAGGLLAAHYLCWYAALDLTTVFNVTVLALLQPFFAMAGGWLLYRTKVRRQALPGILVVIAGAVVMGLMSLRGGGQSTFTGDLLALLTTFFFSAYLLAGQGIRKDVPAALYMVILYGSCTLFLLGAALVSGQNLLPADSRVIAICALLTLSATFLGHSVYNWAVHHVGALYITIITLTEPVGATLIAWLMFREIPVPLSFLGGLLILSGVCWFLFRQYGLLSGDRHRRT